MLRGIFLYLLPKIRMYFFSFYWDIVFPPKKHSPLRKMLFLSVKHESAYYNKRLLQDSILHKIRYLTIHCRNSAFCNSHYILIYKFFFYCNTILNRQILPLHQFHLPRNVFLPAPIFSRLFCDRQTC